MLGNYRALSLAYEDIIMKLVRIWDVPTRLFHWLLVLAIIGLWYTGTKGDMDRHLPLAYFTLTLLLFRFIWGFVGGFYSRFSALQLAPINAIRYLRSGLKSDYPGHNPLGSWSVVGLFFCVAVQLITGLFANDSILFEGPLAHYISGGLSNQITSWHSLNFNILLGLVALHISAVLFYTVVKRDDILPAMITGKRSVSEGVNEPDRQHPARSLIVMAVAAGVVWLISRLGY